MAGSCLKVHPLQNTQRRSQLPSARLVQGWTQHSFLHLKILSFSNHRQLQHDHLGGLACSQLQSGFRPLSGVCVLSESTFTMRLLGPKWSHRPQPTRECVGPREEDSASLPSLGLYLLAQTSMCSGTHTPCGSGIHSLPPTN